MGFENSVPDDSAFRFRTELNCDDDPGTPDANGSVGREHLSASTDSDPEGSISSCGVADSRSDS